MAASTFAPRTLHDGHEPPMCGWYWPCSFWTNLLGDGGYKKWNAYIICYYLWYSAHIFYSAVQWVCWRVQLSMQNPIINDQISLFIDKSEETSIFITQLLMPITCTCHAKHALLCNNQISPSHHWELHQMSYAFIKCNVHHDLLNNLAIYRICRGRRWISDLIRNIIFASFSHH